MDTKTLTHMGGELVVMAGLAFYFQRKCNALEARVNVLEEQNNEIVKVVNVLSEEFDNLYRAVKAQTNSGHSHSGSSGRRPHSSRPRPATRRSLNPPESTFQDSTTETTEIAEASEISENLDNDPDLQKELQLIEQERNNSGTVSESEKSGPICENGVCEIKN